MKFGSVCSGIEAASVAWHPLGWRAAWFAEVDRAASEVLAYRFPDVVNHGDMTTLPGMVLRREIEAPDALVGGTPCQAFSVAGRREGLADARGQLTLSYVDLADAIDRVRADDGDQPCIIVWENVPGVLSSKDNAFGCFLAGLAGEDVPLEPPGKKWGNAGVVLGPKRAIAWRIIDAQYVGLAQRRRRVFVVASAREGFDPAAILLEFDGVRRDSAPRREAGEGTTHATAPCLTSSGRGVERTGDTRGQDPVVEDCDDGIGGDVRVKWPADVASTLNAHFGEKQGLEDQHVNSGCPLFVPHPIAVHGTQDPLTLIDQTFPLGRNSAQENVICFSSKDYGADAADDLSPTLRAGGHTESHANAGIPPAVAYAFQPRIARNGRGDMGDLVNALTAQAGETGKGDAAPCVAYAIQERAVCENPDAGPDGIGVRSDGAAYTLEARTVPQAVAVLPFDTTQLTDPRNGSNPQWGDPCHPMARTAHPPAVCVTEPVTHTLKAEGFDASEDGTGRGQPIVNYVPHVCPTLRAGGNATGGDRPPGTDVDTADSNVVVNMAVRRLMPVECERLQGFPDNWTLVPTGKQRKPAADGPRYKQLGNSMAVNVMRWIGQRIARALGSNGGPAWTLDDMFGH